MTTCITLPSRTSPYVLLKSDLETRCVLRCSVSKMEKMSEKEFDDVSEEPSVTSTDPNERKLARRLRIQRRLEALKKHEGSTDEGIFEKTLTEKQIETSADILEKLIDEGQEVVSNVKVANDARSVDRREEDLTIRKYLLKKLEDEASESLDKYRSINEKWSGILESKDPLEIHSDLQSQNSKCEEILQRKDLVIDELKRELESADEKFIADQKKQSEDVNLLIERIENQVNTIAKAYRRELVMIEEALRSEKSSLLESVSKRWDALYEKRHEEEIKGVEMRKAVMREYETEMKRVMSEHEELYRSEKIELETECQNLQREVQRMKAVCMMNIERLNYSYAVLKRREDENTIIKNQQKRRINKLQDVINALKQNYKDLEEKTRLEIDKLNDQVRKAHKNVSELEIKSEHFTLTNEKQYFDIWDMNTTRANELMEKILTADRIIHEQALGLDWEPPEFPLLKKDDLPSYCRALNVIRQRKADMEESTKMLKFLEKPTNLEELNLERRLLNNILREISDHTSFLIEEKLQELLVPHTYKDNIIIRLDNVFQALGIKSEDQIDLLLNFFLPYSHCVTCANEEGDVSIVGEFEKGESSSEDTQARYVRSEGSQIDEETDNETSIDGTTLETYDESENGEDRVDLEKSEKNKSEETSEAEPPRVVGKLRNNFTCENGHLLEIDTANVTRALREFAEKNRAKRQQQRAPSLREKFIDNRITSLSRSLTNEDVANYWKRYMEIFPPRKEKLWDAILVGLNKYYDVLKERHRLNEETKCLRKQNDELKRLLETYAVKPETDNSASRGRRIASETRSSTNFAR